MDVWQVESMFPIYENEYINSQFLKGQGTDRKPIEEC